MKPIILEESKSEAASQRLGCKCCPVWQALWSCLLSIKKVLLFLVVVFAGVKAISKACQVGLV